MLPSQLIPVPHFQLGFTSNSSIQAENLTAIHLNDEELGVHKVASRTSHPIVSPPTAGSSPDLPAPQSAWEALYPEGSINPAAEIPGGFGFYLSGSNYFASSLSNGATEVVMSYRMMLEKDWEWVKGGKLPGIYGGEGNLAYGCTGGRKEDRCKCFNVRLMWRPGGVGELYVYLPDTPTNKERLLAVPPVSLENPTYGFSVGRGAYTIPVGRWVSVALRIKLNCSGQEDGEIELWIDGVSVISVNGLVLRMSDEGKIKGMHFQTFFGGHTQDWASPKDQRAWFSDVTGVVVQ